MVSVWLVVRAALRQRWRAWLVLAVVAGLLGGLVMAVAAGARRTDAAYPALVAWSRSPDDIIGTVPGLPQTYANVTEAAVLRLPQVSQAAKLDSFTGSRPPRSLSWLLPRASLDPCGAGSCSRGACPPPGIRTQLTCPSPRRSRCTSASVAR